MKIKLQIALLILIASVTLIDLGCKKDIQSTNYKTKNVIILVVDGARFCETWGNPAHQFIPHRSAMLKQGGVFCSRFYNNGLTSTCAGHEAMCTGVYEGLADDGSQYPTNPSIFQYWLKAFGRAASEAYVITTKDKLAILSDCLDPAWKGKYRPNTDCGINGLGTGYREDSTTFKNLKSIAQKNHIRLAIVNFKQPDAAGHAADSAAYLKGIIDTDNYIYQFWNFLQNDPFYKDRTTLIVTNDHGRHTAGHLDGFVSHGDNCDGCKHIEFFAMGPDFKQNYTCETPYEQIDIAKTVAELMGFNLPLSNGKVMKDLFQ
ncbi:MAG: alkaline phosphatase family protein [Bacteroidia bacterium]